MRRKISAICAILAIVLFSNCLTAQVAPTTYGAGGKSQTDPDHIQYHGTIDGQFIDADMVPVRMCDGQLIWAKAPDRIYRIIVEANQHVATGDIVEVVMETRTHWYIVSDYFEIQSVVIKKAPVVIKDTITQKVTPPLPPAPPVKPVAKKKSVRQNRSDAPGGHSSFVQEHYPTNEPCNNTVTINGTVNMWFNGKNGKMDE